MYIKKIYGYAYKAYDDIFLPIIERSVNWQRWVTHITPKTCDFCFSKNGVIVSINENIKPPVHPNCHCELDSFIAVKAGNATKDGQNGADYWLKHYGRLPDYYVSRQEYIRAGWKSGKPPVKWFPGKMMAGGVYTNDDGKLPVEIDRVWREADINYYSGRRNSHRLYYSNDGLIFVSYDHGKTFYEIF